MYYFNDYVKNFWVNINNYAIDNFVIDDGKVHFVRDRKTNLESMMKYPFYNCGRTTSIECLSFIRNEKDDLNMTLSNSDISQRRPLIKHEAYIEMNNDFIDGIYNNPDHIGLYKGYRILAGDSSICDVANIGYTEENFDKLNNPYLNRLKSELIRLRASCIVDAETGFILTSALVNKNKCGEVELALKHIDDLNQRINIDNSITIYDRGYVSTELIIKHMLTNSHFIIRLKNSDFKKERKWMQTNDEIVNININRTRLKNFHDKDLKNKATKIGRIPARITEITITKDNGEEYTETLISNLPFETITEEDLKILYNKRWKIETNFNTLKNIIYIENFSGYQEEIIFQDFYANILLFNFLNAMKLDADLKIQENQEDQNLKHEYQANLNVLFGLIKLEIPYLLSCDEQKVNDAVDRIMKIAQSNLVQKNNKNNRNPERKVKDSTNKFPPTQKRAM